MERSNKIEEIVNSAVEKIKKVIDSSTIIGEKIETKAGVVIPLTKVSIGFVAGGGEYSSDDKQIKSTGDYPFAGGTGAGVCVQPIAFLTIEGSKIGLIKVEGKTTLDKFIDIIPKVTEAVTDAIKEK